MEEDEVAEVDRRIREAKADLSKRAESPETSASDKELVLKHADRCNILLDRLNLLSDRFNILLEEKKRLSTGMLQPQGGKNILRTCLVFI